MQKNNNDLPAPTKSGTERLRSCASGKCKGKTTWQTWSYRSWGANKWKCNECGNEWPG